MNEKNQSGAWRNDKDHNVSHGIVHLIDAYIL